ncbi:MAG TPA: hypothetical protein VFR15_02190, partial [Chloroflexia bacterium]|nr:hypothetical protein [Chloroflexia bacterium]
MWHYFAGIFGLLILCGIFSTVFQSPPAKKDQTQSSAQSSSGVANNSNVAPVPTDTPVPPPTLNPAQAAEATQTVGAASAGVLPLSSGYIYVNETAHNVERFYDTFAEMGGAQSLGFPITEPFIEVVVGGTWRWVQYFEKAVIEYHRELDLANRYPLAALGANRFAQKYPQ